ncbi:MAG: hypothetical protein WCJ03_10270 [Bacteroidales bacterium]
MDRNEFMQFFRDNEKLNLLSIDDRREIFLSILAGASDISRNLLNELLTDYCVDNIEIEEI